MALAAAEAAWVMPVGGAFAGTMQRLSAIWQQRRDGMPVVLVFLRHFC